MSQRESNPSYREHTRNEDGFEHTSSRTSIAAKEVRCGAILVWNEAKPSVIKLSAHLVIFVFAALCVAAMLIATYGLMMLCDLLFVDYEIYVKAACVIGEILLSLYILRFAPGKSMEPT